MSRVLVLCTANQCRSPLGAALLRQRLEWWPEPVLVESAGLLTGGSPVPPEVAHVARQRGLDLSDHVSRQLAVADLERADLVLGMARDHVREAVLLHRDALPRTFTVREFVRRAEPVGPRPSGVAFDEWLDEVRGDRRARDLLGASGEDDVLDPMGGPLEGFLAMAAELDDLMTATASNGWHQP